MFVIDKNTGNKKEVFHIKEDEQGIWFSIYDYGGWVYQQSFNYVPIVN